MNQSIQPYLSPDGRWQWDGYRWVPSPMGNMDARIGVYTSRGWQVTNRTAEGVQLRRPKTFSLLWALAWFLVFGVGVLVYIFWYMAKKDEVIYLSASDPAPGMGQYWTGDRYAR